MSGPPELAIAVGALADGALKATVVLAVAWLGARVALRRGSAAQRHAVWVAAFAVLPLLPVVAAARGAEVALDATPWLLGWATGATFTALAPARGLLELHRLTALAESDRDRPGVGYVEGLEGPITWGAFRPVVLLPRAASQWSEADVEAALAHERAHVERRDWLVHLAAWVVQVLFWFHPVVAFARWELSREAEHAADDAVLAQGVRPSDYASLLISLARPRSATLALGLGPSAVGRRVWAVLDVRARHARRRSVFVAAALIALGTLPALGSWPTWATDEAALECAPLP